MVQLNTTVLYRKYIKIYCGELASVCTDVKCLRCIVCDGHKFYLLYRFSSLFYCKLSPIHFPDPIIK